MNNTRSIGGIIDSALANIVANAVPVLKRHRKLVSEMFDEPLDFDLNHADALRCMFMPTTETEQKLHDKIMNTPGLPDKIIDTSTPSDHRAFLRDLLRAEQPNYRDALYEVRQADPNEYLKRMNDIAKIALPKESNINVDVDIKERQDITIRMQEMYRFSSVSAGVINTATVPGASAPGLNAASQVGNTFGAVETEYEDLQPQPVKVKKTTKPTKRKSTKSK